jgi:hypothetical protein
MSDIQGPTYNKLPEYRSSRTITITTIIACTVLLLACLMACTTVAIVFMINAPWG